MTAPSPVPVPTADELRPTTLDDVIGQQEVKDALAVSLEAAKARGELPGHILFIGPAGTGKTTLALIVAQSVGAAFVPMMGPNLRTAGRDLIPALIASWAPTVFFIDEIHRMYRPVQETLFPVMEDGTLTLSNGRQVDMHGSMFIGATTDPDRLLTPMLDRFTQILRLRAYRPDELAAIATRAATKMGCTLTDDGAALVGRSAMGIPRVAIRMVKASRDYAYSLHDGNNVVEAEAVSLALKSPAYAWRLEGRNAGER